MRTTPVIFSRWLTLSGYFALMAGFYAWHLVFNDTAKHMLSLVFIAQVGPLLFPLRGLLNARPYTHAWSIYLAIFYFVIGVWYSSNHDSLLFGLYIIVTSLMFFSGAVLYTRLHAQQKPLT